MCLKGIQFRMTIDNCNTISITFHFILSDKRYSVNWNPWYEYLSVFVFLAVLKETNLKMTKSFWWALFYLYVVACQSTPLEKQLGWYKLLSVSYNLVNINFVYFLIFAVFNIFSCINLVFVYNICISQTRLDVIILFSI